MKFTHDGTFQSIQSALDKANAKVGELLERGSTRFSDTTQIVSSARKRVDFAVKGLHEAFATVLDEAAAMDLEFRNLRTHVTRLEEESARLRETIEQERTMKSQAMLTNGHGMEAQLEKQYVEKLRVKDAELEEIRSTLRRLTG